MLEAFEKRYLLAVESLEWLEELESNNTLSSASADTPHDGWRYDLTWAIVMGVGVIVAAGGLWGFFKARNALSDVYRRSNPQHDCYNALTECCGERIPLFVFGTMEMVGFTLFGVSIYKLRNVANE